MISTLRASALALLTLAAPAAAVPVDLTGWTAENGRWTVAAIGNAPIEPSTDCSKRRSQGGASSQQSGRVVIRFCATPAGGCSLTRTWWEFGMRSERPLSRNGATIGCVDICAAATSMNSFCGSPSIGIPVFAFTMKRMTRPSLTSSPKCSSRSGTSLLRRSSGSRAGATTRRPPRST